MRVAETQNAVIGIQQHAILAMVWNQQHRDVSVGLVVALDEFSQVVVVNNIDIVDQNLVRIRCQFGDAFAQPPAVVQEFLLLRATDVPVVAPREFGAGGNDLLAHKTRIHHHLLHTRKGTQFRHRQFQERHPAERQKCLGGNQCRRTHPPTLARRQHKSANSSHLWTIQDKF